MIKGKCHVCGIKKAKRICKIKDGSQICPVCCSKLRHDICEGCSFYAASVKYEKGKQQNDRHFTIMLSPEIEEECDRALGLAESGQVAEAEKMMIRLEKKYPNHHTIQYGLGVCCALQEKTEEAIGFFEKAVNIFPYLTEAHFNMALAYSKLGDMAGAVKAYREVIRVGDDEGLISKAKRVVDGMERQVMEQSGITLDTYLKNSKTFYKAFVAMQAGEYTLAVDLFNLILSIDPKHVQSWGNLGLAYACMGQKAKSLECLDRALEIDPKYELAIVNRISVENMEEGECIDWKGENVDYYLDYGAKSKKSYISEVIDFFKKDG